MGTALGAAGLWAVAGAPASAQVSGGTVAAGSAQISGAGTANVLVTQSSRKAVVDWRSFSVAAGDSVRFAQPDRGSVTLNRVTGGTGSRIDGSLTANGQVWLLNPNGVIVGSGGRIAAGGFLATTHALSNDDFMAGRYGFGDAATAGAAVVNAGRIEAGEGGYAVLAGREVANHGLIEARLGTVALGAAKQFTLDLAGDRLLSFAVTGELDALPASGAAAVTNRGALRADGGRVVMTARAAADVVEQVINTTGLVQARSVRLVGGQVVLDGGDSGLVMAAGKLDVSGTATGEPGGRLHLLGDTIIVGDGARLDARGDAGGGEILVGGGWQGESVDGHASAIRVAVAPSATLDASAITSGNGGMVVAWSDVGDAASRTYALGTFRADGGAESGDGGRIETSGHDLITTGVRGSAAARNGAAGTWLFDPYDIEIVNGNTTNLVNPGFEEGANGLAGWTVIGLGGGFGGGVTTTTAATAANGQQFAAQEGQRFLLATAGPPGAQIGVEQAFQAQAGQTISIYGLFLGKDNTQFNDQGLVELLGPNGFSHVLYSRNISQVGTNGTAPWEQTNPYSFEASGQYTIRASVRNDKDGALSSQLGFEVASGGFGGSFGNGSSGQLWTSTANSSKIAVGQVNSLLSAGTNVHISTAGPGTQHGDITVNAEIVKGGSTTASLKLEADRSIIVNQGVRSTAGTLNVDLLAKTGGITVNAPINLWPDGTAAGDVTMNAATSITLATAGTLRGDDIRLNADSMTLGAMVQAQNSITAAPLAVARSLRLGGEVTTDDASLALDNSELARLQAPLLTFGHVSGTGAIDVLTGFAGGANSEVPRQVVVRAPGTSGRINIDGSQTVLASDTWRLIAGNEVKLNAASNVDIAGKLELVAGQKFTNLSTADVLQTWDAGRWLIYSASPAADTFGGLLSGQQALWGQDFDAAAAGEIVAAGNRYAFGLAPELTVVAENRTKTYGEALSFGTSDFTVTGLVSAETFGNVFLPDEFGGLPSLTSAGAAERANVGEYTIDVSTGAFMAPQGYAATQFQSGALTIDPKTIGASLTGIVQKVYDGTVAATLTSANYELSGVLGGDDVRVTTTVGSYADKNAGTGKAVAVESLQLTGASADNYVVSGTAAGAVGQIAPRAIIGTAVVSDKVYDRTIAATGSLTLAGAIANDDVVAAQASFAFLDKNVGFDKAVNVAAMLAGADAGNYTLTIGPAVADITPKTIDGVLTAASKTYDGTTGATGSVSLAGVVLGDIVEANGGSFEFADRNAGVGKTVNVANIGLSGPDAANYALSLSPTTTADIFQKNLTLALFADSKTYDGSVAATGTLDLAGVIEGDDVGVTAAGFAFADRNAGTAKTVNIIDSGLVGLDAANYTLDVPSTALADITPKAVTATASAQDKIYDGTTAANGAIMLAPHAIVAGDMVMPNGASFAFSDRNAGTGKTVNVTGVTLTGSDAGNYSLIAPETTTASIQQKLLSAAIAVEDKVYDGTTDARGAVTLTSDDIFGEDDVAASAGLFTFADRNAGFDRIVNVADIGLIGADAGNYALSVPSTTTADIFRKALGATAFADGKVYDGTTAATGRVDLTGAILGDAVAVNGATFAFANRNASVAKTVNVAKAALVGADAGNYSFVAPTTAFADITPKAITATVAAQNKVYDGTTAATGTVALNGTIAGDLVTPAGASFAFADRKAGTAKTVNIVGVTLAGADAGNYALSTPATTVADILKKVLAANATAASKTYDGTTSASGQLALTGVVAGDAVTTSGTQFAFADRNAGAGKLVNISGSTLAGSDAGNYSLDAPSTTLADILRKQVGVQATAAGKIYDGTTGTTGTVALTGLVTGDIVSTAGAQFAFADPNAGAGKAVGLTGLTLVARDAGNYVLGALPTITADITPKSLTAVLTGSVQKVYDATTAAALSATNYSLDGFVAGEGAVIGQASGSFASPNVGSGLTVTASLAPTSFAAGSGTSLGNYLLPTSASGAIGTINPATLTYVANPAERPRGDMNPPLGGTVSGFVGSDTQGTATTGTLAFTTTAALESPVGLYAINGGGLAAGNYMFAQAAGNATAFRINEAMSAASNVATVVQSATVAPPPTPVAPPAAAPPPPLPPAGPPTSSTAAVAPPPPPLPPPPPAPAPVTGAPGSSAPTAPPPPGPSVEATPPSPVGEQAPPTPSDTADQGDAVLAEADTPEEEQDEAPSEKRLAASATVVVPGVNVEVPTPPRPPEVPGADQSFSGSGNPAQW